MKKGLSITVLLVSALSFSQAAHDVINDFLVVEHKDIKYDSIHVQIEPYDVREAIQLYEQGYNERNSDGKDPESVWVNPYTFKDWPFTEDDIQDIKRKLKKTDKNWSEVDFNNKSFVFKRASVVKDMNFRVGHRVKGTTEYVLRLSRPIFNKKKNFALFKYYFSELLMRSNPSKNRGAVVMKKENGKWIALASIREAIYE